MNPNWYPGYYLDPQHWPEWMPEALPHWLPASFVRTPPAIPPASWPEPSSKPGYGLFDELPERLRPKSFEEQLGALDTQLPVPKPPAPQSNSGLWGGLLPLDLGSQPVQWPDALSASMPPSMTTAESLPQLLLRRQGIVPVLGVGTLAKIAGWPDDLSDDLPVVPVQWPAPFASEPQPAPAWLAGAQWSGAPASPAWPETPEPQVPQPQSRMVEEPTRSAPDAVAERDEPLFVQSGLYPTPPSGHRAPDWLDLSDPFAVAAYRRRNAVQPMFGRGDPQRAEDAIRAGLVSAADPFGIPSWLIGQVSPATKDLIREQYEDHPIASTIGSFATPIPAFVVRAAETAAKAAPKTLATVLGLGGLATSADEAQGAGRLPKWTVGRSAVDKYWRNVPTEFGRNAPTEFGRAPEGEKVARPAVKVPVPGGKGEERVFTGPLFHFEAEKAAERQLRMPKLESPPHRQGWTTTGNRYVSRQQANEIAEGANQSPSKDELGEQLGLRSGGRPRLQEGDAVAPSNVRTAVTAPDLPGGGGEVMVLPNGDRVLGHAAWGWLLSKSEAARLPRRTRPPASSNDPQERALTAFRSDQTRDISAGAMTQEQIYEHLQDAWKYGFDAVILRNYTSPFGRTGDVVVVKDRAQLRDPKARFDPRKRDSRNVMAGFAGAGFLGPYFLGVPRPVPDQ